MKPRRDPLDKERFLEGNRQRWCAIIFALDVLVLILTSCGLLHDPAPFLASFSGVGALFILGASADSVMKIYDVSSRTTSARAENIEGTYAPKHFDDGAIS